MTARLKTDQILKYALLLKTQGLKNAEISLEILKEFEIEINPLTIWMWFKEAGMNKETENKIKEIAHRLQKRNPSITYKDCLLKATKIYKVEKIEGDNAQMREWKEKDYPDKKSVSEECFYCKKESETETDVCKRCEDIIQGLEHKLGIWKSKACEFCKHCFGWESGRYVCKLKTFEELTKVKKCPSYKKDDRMHPKKDLDYNN